MNKQFSLQQKSLLSILSSMQPICTKKTTLETTSAVLFQIGHRELILKGTDLEISLQASCELEQSNFTESLSFIVPGKRVFDVVKELDGTIVCSLESNQLVIKSGSVQLALNIKEANEFPPFPERIENLMQLDASLLSTMLESVAFLIPQNNTNSALNGLYLEINKDGMKMTTTDGHSLAQVQSSQYTLDKEATWLLPRRAIFELKKLIESTKEERIFLGVCGNQLVFSGEFFNFFTKLLSEPFPQYAAILDKSTFHTATVDRSGLLKTLRRSISLLSGQFIATLFGFNGQRLQVSMKNKEVGSLEEELALQGFEGSEIALRFYAPYLLNGLQIFPDDAITFYLKNSTKPIIFESHNKLVTITYLVMPVSPASMA